MSYTTRITVGGAFDDVVETTTDALADEGFGVLCDIDVTEKFAAKLDVDFRDYRILGACNPPLAKEGIDAEPALGALLPCNVAVYADGDDVVVAAVDPEKLVSVTENPDLDGVSEDVAERFDRVLATVEEAY
ncbi:DUF302 domain-containing protein [Halocalculus aciditolerans]|uniref:DUF302 domain-containing protein n=1 Tax=Halocalculus aciditolerans TaxID=1383812 RepID=A0A830FKF8_9EURY|nr:DUF302 domain-containing protein [Halocalculus aciditolerans]GGL64635.1 hypothetical protein GCM10009039_23250 [Halocalculus aciditolerans]